MNDNLQGLMAYKTMRAVQRQAELAAGRPEQPERPKGFTARLQRWLDKALGA